MSVLDAYAILAYLRDEPAADAVARLLTTGDAEFTAVGLGEVFDQLLRRYHADEEEIGLDLAELGLLDPLPVEAALGASAGRLRARHYHRTRCPVSMADCLAAEAARQHARPLATSDPHLLDVCHAEGIQITVLPGTDGSRWTPASYPWPPVP